MTEPVTVDVRALMLVIRPDMLRRARVRYRADPVYADLVALTAVVHGYADATKVAIDAPSAEAWIMTDEAASRLGVKPAAVRRMLREGRLRGIKRGAMWLADAAAVAEREHSC